LPARPRTRSCYCGCSWKRRRDSWPAATPCPP